MKIDSRANQGGILLDFFLILVLIAAGLFGLASWKKIGSLRLPRLPFARAEPAATGVDLARRSAEAQAVLRNALESAGIREGQVVAHFNEERSGPDGRWVESTLEVAPPARFHSGRFLRRLAPALQSHDLRVLRDETRGGRWVLEVGDRRRVFQRLIVRA